MLFVCETQDKQRECRGGDVVAEENRRNIKDKRQQTAPSTEHPATLGVLQSRVNKGDARRLQGGLQGGLGEAKLSKLSIWRRVVKTSGRRMGRNEWREEGSKGINKRERVVRQKIHFPRATTHSSPAVLFFCLYMCKMERCKQRMYGQNLGQLQH